MRGRGQAEQTVAEQTALRLAPQGGLAVDGRLDDAVNDSLRHLVAVNDRRKGWDEPTLIRKVARASDGKQSRCRTSNDLLVARLSLQSALQPEPLGAAKIARPILSRDRVVVSPSNSQLTQVRAAHLCRTACNDLLERCLRSLQVRGFSRRRRDKGPR